MLVLSRNKNQSIMIGDEIEITIIDVRGDRVRIGIAAPKNISVHRKEIYEAIKGMEVGKKESKWKGYLHKHLFTNSFSKIKIRLVLRK